MKLEILHRARVAHASDRVPEKIHRETPPRRQRQVANLIRLRRGCPIANEVAAWQGGQVWPECRRITAPIYSGADVLATPLSHCVVSDQRQDDLNDTVAGQRIDYDDPKADPRKHLPGTLGRLIVYRRRRAWCEPIFQTGDLQDAEYAIVRGLAMLADQVSTIRNM